MGTIIVIIGAVLIALIVIICLSYKAILRKQYQKQPYQVVTGTDLEAEINGRKAYESYKRRQDRLTMLIKALCAAVVIIGGLVYGSVTWWQKSEPERIARAEQKRIEKVEKQRLQEETERQRLQEESEQKRLLKEAEQRRLQEEAERQRQCIDANEEETKFQRWKAKRIAKANKKVDEKWKKYQELVDAKIWIDSADILKQQRERLSEQAEAYKDEFYKLSFQSGKLKNRNAAEEYCLTVEDFERWQNELSEQILQYKDKKDGLLGDSSYEDELDSAYDAFVEASEDLMKAKALTQGDYRDKWIKNYVILFHFLFFLLVAGWAMWNVSRS